MLHWLLNAFGLIGNIGFGFASGSLALHVLRTGRSETPAKTAWIFLISCTSFGAFLIGAYGFNWLFSVLAIESVAWTIVLFYTYFPRPPRYLGQFQVGDLITVGGQLRRVTGFDDKTGMRTKPCCPHGDDWDWCPDCRH